jgi:hypothetical protein
MLNEGLMGKIFKISTESELVVMAPPSEYMDGRLPLSADPRIIGRLKGPVIVVRKVKIEEKGDLSTLIHG